MYRHETITLIVGVLLLSALGWVYWDLSGKVMTVADSSQDIAQRVDTLAKAMPNLGVRIAFEEIHRELTGAVR